MRGAYYFDLFAFTNNLIYRDKSSIFGGINNPPICSVLRFKALKILSLLMHNRFFCWFRKIISKGPLRQRCWGEDFLPPKEFLMLYSELSGFRKEDASNVLICSVKNIPNYLDLKKDNESSASICSVKNVPNYLVFRNMIHQLSWYVVSKISGL